MNSLPLLLAELAQLVSLIAQARGSQTPSAIAMLDDVAVTAQNIFDRVQQIQEDGDVSSAEVAEIQSERHQAVERWRAAVSKASPES